ncbi:hypothetical protein Tco_0092368 [Tanacetum coccineum]
MRDVASSLYHSLNPSGTLPLLPIPLPAPSTSRRADIPEADTPPWKRLLLTTPRPECEVGESSADAAARQPGPTMAHRVDYSLVDTMETRFKIIDRRDDHRLRRCQLRRVITRQEETLPYEQESMKTRQALARSEAHCRALEARVTVLETDVHRHEWQLRTCNDLAGKHIIAYPALEAEHA